MGYSSKKGQGKLGTGATIVLGSKAGTRLLLAYLALVAGIVCVAWSAAFVRSTNIPGPASAFYRMLIPAVAQLPTFLFDRQGMQLNRRMLGIMALGGLFFALDLDGPGGHLVILWSDLGKHMRFGMGDLMALGAAACFAVYLLVTERVRTSTNTLGFLRLAMISSTVALFVINWVMGISLRVPHGQTLWAILGLGLVGSLGVASAFRSGIGAPAETSGRRSKHLE